MYVRDVDEANEHTIPKLQLTSEKTTKQSGQGHK